MLKTTEREELIRAVTTGGESVAAAAARIGVGASTGYGWVKAATGGGRRSAAAGKPSTAQLTTRSARQPLFVELTRANAPAASVVVRVSGAEIAVRRGFDAALLRSVVAALSGDGGVE
jgi:transposase